MADGFAIGDRVETGLGNFVTLHAYQQPIPPGEYWTPARGQEFAAADVEFCLGSAEGQTAIGPADFELQMGDNTRRAGAIAAREPALHYTEIGGPGDCVRGWVTYEVPAGERPAFLLLLNTDPLIRFTL